MNKKSRYYLSDADAVSHIYLKEDPALSDDPHFHDSIEFVFITNGRVKAHLEQKEKDLSSLDIFFVESYETHYYEAIDSDISAIVLVLSREYIQTFRELYPNLTFDTYLTNKEANKELFDLMKEWLKKGSNTKILNYGETNLLFASLIKKYKMIPRHEYEGEVLEKTLLRYIHLHYLEDISLVSISKELGFSPEYCSKILKKCIPCGFRYYINSLRIRKAKELLSDKSLNLSQSEVLYQCGFSSPSTYYRVKKQIENE
ncbi:MAG: helix-turn-helix domain-containing protein [Bacilli bacterium]|nr:helix-turn-helix domain-containing protein [Bacilli bacterium]